MQSGITVAYSGVHQAYQLALAAQEIGQLDRFYCSLFAMSHKWGGALAQLLGMDILYNRFVDGIPPEKVYENPWPLFLYRSRVFLRFATPTDWEQMNIHFDSCIATRVSTDSSRIFVGVETCCALALEVAQKRGMKTVVDWPGVSTPFLNALAVEAAHEFSLNTAVSADTPVMHSRKEREMELADVILTCSDFHARTLRDQGCQADKLRVIPLWVDTQYWQPRSDCSVLDPGPLRVLFAGKISVRKGIPYLVLAASACNTQVTLTLVGRVDDELVPFLKAYGGKIKIMPPCSKTELRKHYQNHDVFVLPSLGDSFGFVAMEAMACGLPVIVTQNCGVPVPDSSWRVPIMDSDAIARRLTLYAEDRDLCREHGLVAAEFARQYTPERYRGQVKALYRRLLNLPTAADCATDSLHAGEPIDPNGEKETRI
jgi:glycosyltransferase involved in cell wall biosynthesis